MLWPVVRIMSMCPKRYFEPPISALLSKDGVDIVAIALNDTFFDVSRMCCDCTGVCCECLRCFDVSDSKLVSSMLAESEPDCACGLSDCGAFPPEAPEVNAAFGTYARVFSLRLVDADII